MYSKTSLNPTRSRPERNGWLRRVFRFKVVIYTQNGIFGTLDHDCYGGDSDSERPFYQSVLVH